MRKVVFFLAMMATTFFVSCSGNGPEGVAEKFIVHSSKGEFAEAKKYCTESTGQLLSMAEAFAGDKINEIKEKNKGIKVDIVSSEVKDSTATVSYKVSGIEGAAAEEKSLDLVKRSGDWKVNINKENPAGGEVPAAE